MVMPFTSWSSRLYERLALIIKLFVGTKILEEEACYNYS